jgi:hypothetical protein
MKISRTIHVWSSISVALAVTSANQATVDLGYEIHQATFNVCHQQHTLSVRCQGLTKRVFPGIGSVLQFLECAICSTSNWEFAIRGTNRTLDEPKGVQRWTQSCDVHPGDTRLGCLLGGMGHERDRGFQYFSRLSTSKHYVPAAPGSFGEGGLSVPGRYGAQAYF